MMKKIIIFLFILFFHSNIYAGVGYYNNYQHLIGDRAAGLGGAYTALANDSTALWYNPAGLANVFTSNLNIAVNGYNYIKTDIDGYIQMEDTGGDYHELNWHDSDISVVAHTLAYAKKIGSGGTLGFGLFVPYQDDIHGLVEGNVETDTYDFNVRYESNLSSKSMYGLAGYGSSVGKSFNYGFSIGIGYLTERAKDSYFEHVIFPVDDTAYNSSGYYLYEASGFVAEASLGFQFRVTESTILALKFTSPSYSIYYKSKEKEVEMYAGSDSYLSDPDEVFFNEDVLKERDTSFWQYYPAKISIGYAYTVRNSFSVAVDVIPTFKSDETAEGVINYKAGIEKNFGRNLIFRAGFFTDFSQKGDLDESSDYTNSIDYYGATLNMAFSRDLSVPGDTDNPKYRAITNIGLVYRWGSGSTKANYMDTNLDETEIIKDQAISSITFFIGESLLFD